MKAKGTQKRGFAVMAPERVREIAAKGGKRAHELGLAHQWDSEEASEAGKIGGRLKGPRKRTRRTPEPVAYNEAPKPAPAPVPIKEVIVR